MNKSKHLWGITRRNDLKHNCIKPNKGNDGNGSILINDKSRRRYFKVAKAFNFGNVEQNVGSLDDEGAWL